MTREDITRMAREAGIRDCTCNGEFGCLERFVALVSAASEAKEREACARMAEAFHHHQYDFTGNLELHEAIRARGQA